MSIKTVDDFDYSGPSLLKGAHGQQIVDALRALDQKEGYDTAHAPRWDIAEIWPGVISGLYFGSSSSIGNPAPTPAMYYVNRLYIGGGNTDDTVQLYAATDQAQNIVPATNISELSEPANRMEIGDDVVVFAMFDRGAISRKRYIFIGPIKPVFIKVTGNRTGGGYYTAVRILGEAYNVDTTIDLQAPLAPETASPITVTGENWSEANGAYGVGSHIVPPNKYFVAYLVGYTKDNPPQQIYRFTYQRLGVGQVCLQGDGDPTCVALQPTTPSFTTPLPTDNLYFNLNWFKVYSQAISSVPCENGNTLVDWSGHTWIYNLPGPYPGTTKYCSIQIVQVNALNTVTDPAAPGWLGNAPVPQTITNAPSPIVYNTYPVFFTLSDGTIVDPCACSGDLNKYNFLDMEGHIALDPCKFLPVISASGATTAAYPNIAFDPATFSGSNSGTCPGGTLTLTGIPNFSAVDCNGNPVGTTAEYNTIQASFGLVGTPFVNIYSIAIQIGSDSTTYLSADCNGLHFTPPSPYVLTLVNCTSSTTVTPVTQIQVINGLNLSGTTPNAIIGLSFTGVVTVGGMSSTGTVTWDISSPCTPVLRVDIPPYPTFGGIELYNCPMTDLGAFTSLTSGAGITLSGTAPNGVITANFTPGMYTTVTVVGCAVVIDVASGAFTTPSDVATAISTAIGMLPTSYPPSGPAGGDLSGTYPDPAVSKINGTPLGTTAATAGTILVGTGTTIASVVLSGDATISGAGVLTIASNFPRVVANRDLSAQTAAVSSVVTYTPATTHDYEIGVYLNVSAISGGVLAASLSWTDENGTAQTGFVLLAGITSPGVYPFPSTSFGCGAGAITVSTTLSGGTVLYNVRSWIRFTGAG